jgi:hypothetical protein
MSSLHYVRLFVGGSRLLYIMYVCLRIVLCFWLYLSSPCVLCTQMLQASLDCPFVLTFGALTFVYSKKRVVRNKFDIYVFI